MIVHALKGLERAIGVSYLHPYRDERGWAFAGDGFTEAD
jgi:glutathionyl-hydroquinone reductase